MNKPNGVEHGSKGHKPGSAESTCLITAFLAVHASRESALTEKADVVLPSPQWYQREGSFINMEGRNVAVHAAFKTPDGFLSETECFDRLSEKMGK